MDLGITGRACIVTGASRGIGLATARLLCAEGADVLLCARGADPLQKAVGQLDGPGRTAALELDVTAPDAGELLADACEERFGRIDGLVNNAGTSSPLPLEELSDEDWQGQWELNVMGPMRAMRAVAPRMAERGWGRIVNVASSAGKRPSPRNPAYAVTKAAELSLSRTYADAYARAGVLVNAVAPGPVGSPLWLAEGGMADQIAQREGKTRDEVVAATAGKVPRGELASEAEIAAVIVFLCSELAANVIGAAWSVDGGTVQQIV